jgi:hypothetical protein
MKQLIFHVFLVLLMLSSACYRVEAKIGLGYSPYGVFAIVYVGRSSNPFPVGRVYNVGDEPLWINCIWQQKVGNKTLPMSVSPLCAHFQLLPEGSQQIILVLDAVTKDYLGEYYGEVEFFGTCVNSMEVEGSGGKLVPGGTFPTNISVVKMFNPPCLQLSNLTLTTKTLHEGDTLGASVWAANLGDLAENFSFTLKIDEALMRDKTVRLDGGESQQVTFSFVVANAGEHMVHIVGSWSGGNVTLSDMIAVLGEGMPWKLILTICIVILIMFAIVIVVHKHGKIQKKGKQKENE